MTSAARFGLMCAMLAPKNDEPLHRNEISVSCKAQFEYQERGDGDHAESPPQSNGDHAVSPLQDISGDQAVSPLQDISGDHAVSPLQDI